MDIQKARPVGPFRVRYMHRDGGTGRAENANLLWPVVPPDLEMERTKGR